MYEFYLTQLNDRNECGLRQGRHKTQILVALYVVGVGTLACLLAAKQEHPAPLVHAMGRLLPNKLIVNCFCPTRLKIKLNK